MKAALPSLALTALLLGACHGKWPADMSDQPAVQPLEGPRPAPEGSLPVGGVETLDDREDAAELQNPFAHDPGALLRGAHLFATHCAVCHGPEGRGGGKISTKFPPAPDLRYQTICRRTDGFIYGTVTAGGKAMPSMREGLTAQDRWALVTHVRHLQEQGCVAALPTTPGASAPTEVAP